MNCFPKDHMATVTYTNSWRDWFRRRYWVRCWDCDGCWGPYRMLGAAQDMAAAISSRNL